MINSVFRSTFNVDPVHIYFIPGKPQARAEFDSFEGLDAMAAAGSMSIKGEKVGFK